MTFNHKKNSAISVDAEDRTLHQEKVWYLRNGQRRSLSNKQFHEKFQHKETNIRKLLKELDSSSDYS